VLVCWDTLAVLRARLLLILTVLGVVPASCSSGDDGTQPQSKPAPKIEDLLDSKSCGGCHREHYKEWAGSMHAYAADMPACSARSRPINATSA
jgi:hypothetical protein